MPEAPIQDPSRDPQTTALAHEARRIYLRYAVEVVEALGFCPWARAAREAGRVAMVVVRGHAPEMSELLPHVLAADGQAGHDVTLVLMPECRFDRAQLARFVASLRERYDAAVGRARAALAIADFHPQAEADTRSPERLVPFVRRSPDPTLQLVRHTALEAVRRGASDGTRFLDEHALSALDPARALGLGGAQSLSQRIASSNAKTLERIGLARVEATLQDIARDRDAAYRAALAAEASGA